MHTIGRRTVFSPEEELVDMTDPRIKMPKPLWRALHAVLNRCSTESILAAMIAAAEAQRAYDLANGRELRQRYDPQPVPWTKITARSFPLVIAHEQSPTAADGHGQPRKRTKKAVAPS
jgi:hypothetical protein